jgi:Gpi18-like mannosyltransferase
MALAFIPGYLGDQIPWAILARSAILQGLSHVYALTLAEPLLGVYPPLYHYLLALVGTIYQGLFSSSFTIYTFPLNLLLKGIPILGDCLVGMLIYIGVRRLAGEKNAVIAIIAFIINPAIIYTSAYWGMFGDSLYTFCVLLSLLAICSGKTNLACIAIIAGVSIKPQAVVYLPIIMLAIFKVTKLHKWYQVGIVGIMTLGSIWLPFILSGTVSEAIAALRQTIGLSPVLSANAHNFWYLFSQGNSWVSDAVPLIGPLTARTLGLVSFSIIYAYILYTSWRSPFTGKRLFSDTAYIAFNFFILNTEMHENYLFPTVTLLTFSFWQSKFLKAALFIITITSLANMALHDPLLKPSYWLPLITVSRLTILNSGINLAVFIIWTYIIIHGSYTTSTPYPSSQATEFRDAT